MKNQFPIYTKYSSFMYNMILSENEEVEVMLPDDACGITVKIRHTKYSMETCGAFDEITAGECEIITKEQFIDAFKKATQAIERTIVDGIIQGEIVEQNFINL